MRLFLPAAAVCLFCLTGPALAGPVADRIYPAPTAPLSLTGLPEGAEMIGVRTSDGLDLKGIAVPALEGRPVLLVFHGNGSSAANAIAWLKPLIAKGYGVVAAEYRGYSGNSGTPGEAGLTADAEAFYAYARTAAGKSPLWVVGHSLGGGVALDLAKREKLDALVTVGAFTRLRAMAPKMVRAMVPNEYDNLDAVAKLDEPYFLVHGTADATVPSSEGEKLHSAAGAAHRQGGSFVIIGADHRPDGSLLIPILESISGYLENGRLSAAGLPGTIKLVPFGQSKPLNP